MQPMIAESAPHRARLFWVTVACGLGLAAAAITPFAAIRSVIVQSHKAHGIHQIGRCADLPRIHHIDVTPPIELPSIRVIDAGARVITVHPRPPAMVGDLLITY